MVCSKPVLLLLVAVLAMASIATARSPGSALQRPNMRKLASSPAPTPPPSPSKYKQSTNAYTPSPSPSPDTNDKGSHGPFGPPTRSYSCDTCRFIAGDFKENGVCASKNEYAMCCTSVGANPGKSSDSLTCYWRDTSVGWSCDYVYGSEADKAHCCVFCM